MCTGALGCSDGDFKQLDTLPIVKFYCQSYKRDFFFFLDLLCAFSFKVSKFLKKSGNKAKKFYEKNNKNNVFLKKNFYLGIF
jgi:hypothetical protein